jgi:hypothetical protein
LGLAKDSTSKYDLEIWQGIQEVTEEIKITSCFRPTALRLPSKLQKICKKNHETIA